jgi:hypothetical protein
MLTVEPTTSTLRDERWPALPLESWVKTKDTLHMWTQIVGKLKVELSPFLNQLWHTALHLTVRGLTTGPMPYGPWNVQADFDFVDHNLRIVTSRGGQKVVPLYPRSVASFYEETMACLSSLGIEVRINTTPQEVESPVPFESDIVHDHYDADAANRFFRILSSSARVMWDHKSRFVGKASPVQFFWGSFDLTTTRHSGDPAPVPKDKDYIYRVAENEANWAGGFWPGSGPIDYPAFYAYAIPMPPGLPDALVTPSAARWNDRMKEFILPYDAIRLSDDPEGDLLAFFDCTYDASADLAGWNRARLEISELPTPRPLAR